MAPIFNALIQFAVLVGSIYLIGFIISLINSLFYRIIGESTITCHVTGLIGTPIHELSHALFCLIFFHKIEEIKLFQISDEDGTLGYVKHSYNPKNIYQVIGNFFIGTAPIIVGTFVLLLLMRFMVPDLYQEELMNINTFLNNNSAISINGYLDLSIDVFLTFFSGFNNVLWWVYLITVLCIALHMNFSKPDFKGSLGSLPLLLILIVIINVVLGYLVKDYYYFYLYYVWMFFTYLIVFLFMSLLFSLITLIIAIIIRVTINIIKKKKGLA